MARPKKQTVDYFPHYCIHKKTMFILEQKYGNDGYAFWFKILELLGSTEGHFLKLKNGVDWEFLIAKTKLDKEKCTELLDLLANLDAIDKELWKENNVVWSDNFIENIKDAYRNRVVEIPLKPSILRKKPRNNKDNQRKKSTDEMKVYENKEYIYNKIRGKLKRYLDFIYLSEEEYKKLIDKLRKEKTSEMVERLNNYIGQIGEATAKKKYLNHYYTILNWVRKDEKDGKQYKPQQQFKTPKKV